MVPPIPFDVAIAIIDQAEDDPRSLRNLALTSHDFLRRSRRHLLTWHVLLRSPEILFEFCDHLDANPHLQPFVRCVTLGSNAYYVPVDERPSVPALFYITPMRLLKLPNLRHWKLECFWDKEFFLHLHRSQLNCLRAYSASITTLDIHGVNFVNQTEFVHFLFAFPGIRSLKVSSVDCKRDGTEVAFVAARDRLAKQLHLTSLDINDRVKRSLEILLLEICQPTIETLAIYLPEREDLDEERIHALIHGMSALRSVTISQRYDVDVASFIVDAWALIKGLPSSPARNHTIVVESLPHLHYALGRERLVNIRGQLEQLLIRRPSHSIVFQGRHTKPCREKFWTTTLARHFPELHRQGRFAIKGDKFGDAYYMAGHDDTVWCFAISPDSKWLASGSDDGTIIVWDAQRGNIILQWAAHNRSVYDLAFSPDSRFMMSEGRDHLVIIWDVEGGGAEIATLEGHDSRVDVCAWSPNGTLLASGDGDGTVRVWDAKSFAQLHSFEIAVGVNRQSVCFSPDGRWLAFIREKEKCCNIWDTVNCRSHKTLRADKQLFGPAPVFDPSSERIAVAATDLTIHVWSVETAEELVVLRGHEGRIRDVAFSPSGDWVLSASSDKTAKVWDSHTGDMILSLSGHTHPLMAACFSPDGKYVASGSEDTTVRLWRTSDGSCVRRFTEHTNGVRHVLFSPDGETLCSGADNGTVVIRRFRDILL